VICLNLTKAKNAREETVAKEYRNFVRNTLSQELPKEFAVNFIHWDMKEKKRKDQKIRFEIDLLDHAKGMLEQTNFFSCIPTKHND